jgi:hypothetical protein
MIWQMGRDPHVPVVLLDDIPRPRFEEVAGRVATGGAPNILLLVIEKRLVFLAEPLDQLA